MRIKGLEPWQQPIFWIVVVCVAPFILIAVAFSAFRRKTWAGKILLRKD